MSFDAMSWAKGKAPTLASQAVLLMLANYADEWGVTYVGQDTLAADCSCRKATVSENLKKLEAESLIGRVRRRDAGGRRTSDHVVLAPLAADRGAMRDADKRAGEKHPAEVCELAHRQDTPAVSGSAGDHDTPDSESRYASHPDLDTPGVPEPSEEPSESSEGAKAPSPALNNDLDARRLCRLLADLMGENDDKAKVPEPGTQGRERWVSDMRLLVGDRDGDLAEVERVIRWCQADEFERSNILSPGKLRKRFGQLRLKAMRGTPSNVVPMQRPASIERMDGWRDWYHPDGGVKEEYRG